MPKTQIIPDKDYTRAGESTRPPMVTADAVTAAMVDVIAGLPPIT